MPRGHSQKARSKSFSTLAFYCKATNLLYLVKFILIKIGNIPLRIIYFIINTLLAIKNLQFKLHLPDFKFLRRSRKAGRPKKLHLSKRTKILLTLGTFLLFLFSYTVLLLTAAYQLPTPTKLASSDQPLTTEFYDRNGILLHRLYEGKNRTLTQLSDLPPVLIQATLAAEDKNFYSHMGIDPLAIIRALYHNFKFGTQEGGSTITQQLIKNSLLTPEKSYTRKIKETILALWAEAIYPKDEILQMYFNEAPYGGVTTGIAAAAYTYFNKFPSELSLAESAYLAGLPASPTQFSPYGRDPKLAKSRQKEVLQRMVEEKYITQIMADTAFAQDLNIKTPANNIKAAHFVFYIRDLLAEQFGARIVSQGGLKVYTTLDLKLQEKVEKIVTEEIDKLAALNVQNGAAMVTDARTGQILAMAGSRDFRYPKFGNFNVTLALRPPGSAIKPITYAVAFTKGFNPGSILLDTPVTFRDEWGNTYSPVNYDGKFRGPVSMRQALASSLNLPAVRLLANLGIGPVAKLAGDLGITTFDNPERFGLSLTLGGADTRMIEMMGAYGTFSQMGKYNKPTGILKVTDSSNNVLEEYKSDSKQVLSPEVAYLITHILSDDNARSLAFGPHSLLEIPGFEAAVKTGTSDYKKDNVTFGYTPQFVVGTWVGNPDNSPMRPALASGITGAAPIWNRIMHTLLDNSKPVSFKRPAGIIEVTVGGKKELAIAGSIPKAMVRVQKNENKLLFSDSYSLYSTPSAQAASTEDAMN